jgi:O-antigen/teichoic acid export membrane protein
MSANPASAAVNQSSSKVNMSMSRMAINATTNALQSVCNIVISFWLTRHLIHSMGIAQYGMYPLTKNIVEYFSLVTALIVIPAGRNLMMELSRDNIQQANKVFNSFFFGVVFILCFVVPVLIIVVIYSPSLVKSPPGLAPDIQLLFAAVSFSFILNALSAPFGLAPFVKNSLYLKNIGDFFEQIVFATIAAVLTGFAGWGLPALALATSTRAIIRLGWAAFNKRRLLPQLSIRMASFDIRCLQDILSMSGWFLVSAAGTLLYVNSDLLVVNRIFGAEATGRYGSLLILFNSLATVSGMVTSVMNPPLMNIYAREGLDRFIKSAITYSRMAGTIIAIPIGLVCGFAGPLLTLWLGPSFANLAPILTVLSFGLIFEISMVPIATLRLLEKKLKTPSLVYIGLGIVKIAISIALTTTTGLGLMGMAIGTAMFLVLNAGVVTPMYCAHIAKRPLLFFYRALAHGLAGMIFMTLFSWLACRIAPVHSFVQLALASSTICVLYGVFAWYLLLDIDQRRFISTKIASKMKLRL